MKKFLALVLALVMTMSLVTISAGAEDFTDDSSITYEEAVDVMTSLGIVGGYADGSFNPTATLTRGAAAKIICNMILGPTEAGALSTVEAPFKDVPADHVFAGYIAYCASEGIVGGYSDGTFRPAATLTGYAFWKMLLGALGYDAANENYTGTNYAINVAKRGLNIGLDDGLKGAFSGGKALTREEACLYAFNTLKADMVEYDNDSKITIGDLTISNSSKAEAITGDKDAKNIWTESGTDVLQFAERYFSDLKFENGTDAFGRPAITWWNGVKNDDHKVGQYVSKAPIATFEGITTEKEIYSAVSGSGVSATIAEIYEDGVQKDAVTYTKAVTNNAPYCGNGIKVEIYDVTPNGKTTSTYRLVAIRDYLATVTGVNKAKESTDTKRSLNITLETVPSGFESKKACEKYETESFAKDDVLVVNVSGMTGKIVVKAAELAEKLEDKAVSSYKQGVMHSASVTVDGETLAYSQTYTGDAKTDEYTMTTGNTYSFYLDTYGNVLKSEVYSASSNDYYKVLAVSASKDDGFGADTYFNYKVVDMTGTISTVSAMAKATTSEGTITYSATAAAGNIITMQDDDDNDGKKVLSVLGAYNSAEENTAGTESVDSVTSFKKTSAYIDATNKKIAVDNSTVFVLQTGTNKFKAVTGLNNMGSYTLESQTVKAVTKKGVAVVVYMDVTGKSATSASDDLVYIVGTSKSVSWDATNKYSVYTYTAVIDGEKVPVATTMSSISEAGLYIVSNYKDGYVSQLTPATSGLYNKQATTGADEVTFKNGVLTIDGTAYVVDEDVNVLVLDEDNELTANASVEALTGDEVNGVFYLVEKSTSDDTIVTIYFQGIVE